MQLAWIKREEEGGGPILLGRLKIKIYIAL